MEVANAAMDLGFDTDEIDVVDSVPDAVARALDVTPADGQVIVTGSLYTVGAARSVPGPASAPVSTPSSERGVPPGPP